MLRQTMNHNADYLQDLVGVPTEPKDYAEERLSSNID